MSGINGTNQLWKIFFPILIFKIVTHYFNKKAGQELIPKYGKNNEIH